MAGQLMGMETPVGMASNLQITPYVIGEAVARDAEPTRGPVALGDFGADLKYSVLLWMALTTLTLRRWKSMISN